MVRREGRRAVAARDRDVDPAAVGGRRFAIARVEVTTSATATTQLSAAALRPRLGRDRAAKAESVLARVVAPDEEGSAVRRGRGRRIPPGLADRFATGSFARRRRHAWIAAPLGAKTPVVPADAPSSRVGSAEQSNTSIVFDRQASSSCFGSSKPGDASRRRGHALSHARRALPAHAGAAWRVCVSRTADRRRPSPECCRSSSPNRRTPGATRSNAHGRTSPRRANSEPHERDSRRRRTTRRDDPRDARSAGDGDDDDRRFAPSRATPEDVDRWAHRTQAMDSRRAWRCWSGSCARGQVPKERARRSARRS